ncbi:sensor histidine kinase [Streptomyces sp. NPDC017448]|uniref:sensor histidine kinase n=1 Tax=Streptomyces sp. NPDC017448 TaxID=3364996 RepID=UPI0037A6F261
MPPQMPRGRAADVAAAGAVGLAVVLGSLRSLFPQDRLESVGATAASWVLIALACGALYFRRRWPVAVAGVCTAATGAYYLVSSYDGPLMIVPVVALYAVAATGGLRAAIAIAAVMVIGIGAGSLAGNDEINGITIFMLTGWLVAVIALGTMFHGRGAYAEQEAARRATEERLRIARELHDVIGHNISLINVQASAALHRLKKNPAQAEEALAAIKASSKEALSELRTTLGILRQVDEAAPTAPAPGLDRLDDLVASARRAGLEVTVDRIGRPHPLTAAVDLAVFRILQESLTNVARHAQGASAVAVRIDYAPRELNLTVTDNGRCTATAAPGSGIAGMRERAAILGGGLSAGPGPGGGFAVTARIPYKTRSHLQP